MMNLARVKRGSVFYFGCNCIAILVAIVLVNQNLNAEVWEKGDRHFTLKVLPILKDKCLGCHGDTQKKVKGNFNMSSRRQFLAGGDTIKNVLVPGASKQSFLITAVKWEDKEYEMPPKENDRLTDKQISYLEEWIDVGAPWPGVEIQKAIHLQEREVYENEDGILVSNSGGQSDGWTYRRYKKEDIWAFQPLQNIAMENTVPDHPIDYLVNKKYQTKGITKTKRATPRELIRRATYDLTGLPPSPNMVDSFLKEYKVAPEKAWADLIDDLLASSQYGERWAQHWLDITRYADTGGYSNDYERSNAWRYRDYVIRSFNNDKPYNNFIVEQIAGDELADQSLRERVEKISDFRVARAQGRYNEKESEHLVASGFLRMGPWDPAMVKKPEARQIYIDDIINSVGQTFLSMTLRCVKCHDHKFDPIPTRDYYRFYAVFEGTQLAERPAPFLSSENKQGFKEGKELVGKLLGFAKEKKNHLVAKREAAAKGWYNAHGKEYVGHKERKSLPDAEKPPRHVGLDHIDQGRLKVREQDEWIWNRRLERYEPMVQSVYNGPVPNYLNARKLRAPQAIKANWRPESHILLGGALEAPGEKVSPGVLSALGVRSNPNEGDPFAITKDLAGRRLQLARWIASPDNPLTSRSIINRVWQYHFGKPIAGNPNNFGVKGKKPTHPELLDWLAREFINGGGRFKKLHKLIMTSETYMMSASHKDIDLLNQIDPDNELLSYYPSRRLSAEEIRDSMLAISGELNYSTGGTPSMPEMNIEVALQPRMIQFSIAPAYQPSPKPEQRHRRSIYMYRIRGLADPFMEIFNLPNPNDSCEERDSAAVSPQVFSLLNSDQVTDRSIAFALRLEALAENDRGQITQAIRLAYGRPPMEDELSYLEMYLKKMEKYHQKNKPEKRMYPTSVTRELVEEFSGKPFKYEEILPVFHDYQSDAQAHEVSPKTRALADICLLLFNSNEFIYLN